MLENSRKFCISFISPKFPRTENKIADTVGHFVEKLIVVHNTCKPKVSDLLKQKALP
jgi:hypothetical protein